MSRFCFVVSGPSTHASPEELLAMLDTLRETINPSSGTGLRCTLHIEDSAERVLAATDGLHPVAPTPPEDAAP